MEMTVSFADFLNSRAVDAEVLEHAVRSYVAESTDDLSVHEQSRRLADNFVGEPTANDIIAAMARHPEALEECSLIVLSCVWSHPDQRAMLVSMIEDAKKKLPVIEVGIIATAVMYGMYLVATRGVRRDERIVKKTDEGYVESTFVEYHSPYSIVSSVIGMFRPGERSQAPPSDDV